MDDSHESDYKIEIDQIRMALLKQPLNRSYDDLLLLKSYLSKTEFITKNLAGIVNPKQMNDICRNIQLESYGVGEVVFNQGDVGDKVYIILSGECEVKVRYKIDLTQGQSEIREKLIVTYGSGHFFGERALQFDEPRSASVICTMYTNLVTVSKNSYLSVLNEAKKDISSMLKPGEQLGTKESVVKILSKIREKRSNQELEAVAAYLARRIPFFQKFSSQHLIELCRVADTVAIWGRSILFKQGQIGQAFYVILTGNVEVWVNNDHEAMVMEGKSLRPTNHKGELTDGLGVRVNQLVSGDVFGERALENESSQRMASIVTCEDLTELLVISKEDYHNLVYVMMHSESMHKLSLLRKTEIFRTMDVLHLRVLTRFMESKKFQIDEPLYESGKKAFEMIIIETGECRVETDVKEGIERLGRAEKQRLKYHHYLEDRNSMRQKKSIKNGAENLLGVKNNDNNLIGKHVDDNNIFHPKKGKEHYGKRRGSHSNDLFRKPDSEIGVSKKKISFNVDEQISQDHSLDNLLESSLNTIQDAMPNSEDLNHTYLKSKPKLKRYNTSELIRVEEVKRINLGRIAPNSVLASYITLCESIHDEVYHPETVIASTLVTSFVVSKHDFYNHLPKDTRAALTKVIAEFKPPTLYPLWENTPKKLNEVEWKRERTWERFKQQMMKHEKDADILLAYHHFAKMHITASSGNDESNLVSQKNSQLFQSREAREGSRAVVVDLDWGLRKLETSNDDPKTANLRQDKWSGLPTDNITSEDTDGDSTSLASLDSLGQLKPASSKSGHRKRLSESHSSHGNQPPSIVNSAVSHMIRNRINLIHFNQEMVKREMAMVKKETSEEMKAIQSDMEDTKEISYPFFLVQLHREKRGPLGQGNQFENSRKMVRCYLRLCGSVETSTKAKELAEMQMENIYLTLFRSNAAKENELILNWNPFKGFDCMSLNESDHFLIYCRGAPLEYASISPSRNIFNHPFPSICKLKYQRYACVLINSLYSSRPYVHSAKSLSNFPSPSKLPSDGQNNNNNGNGGGSNKKATNSNPSTPKAQGDNSVSGSNPTTPSSRSQRRKAIKVGFSNSNSNANGADTSTSVAVLDRTNNRGASSSSLLEGYDISSSSNLLLEFSALNEVLVTTSSRIDALSFAIKRFGRLNDDSTASLDIRNPAISTSAFDQNLGTALSASRDEEEGIRPAVHSNDSANVHSQRLNSQYSKIHLKELGLTHTDRVLIQLHQGKKACVFPLFKWILVNEETLSSLDFRNSFDDATVKMIVYEDEFDRISSSLTNSLVLNPNIDRVQRSSPLMSSKKLRTATDSFLKPTKNIKALQAENNKSKDFFQAQNDRLVKSFSEVGLMQQPVDKNNSVPSQVMGLDVNSPDIEERRLHKQYSSSQSLKILERDLKTTELSRQVEFASNRVKAFSGRKQSALPSPFRSPNRPNTADSDYFEEDTIFLRPLPKDNFSKYIAPSVAASATSGSGNSNQNYDGSIKLEARLRSLNDSMKDQIKLIETHDYLCRIEHSLNKVDPSESRNLNRNISLSTSALPTRGEKMPLATRKKLVTQRLEVIESLQNLNVTGKKEFSSSTSPTKRYQRESFSMKDLDSSFDRKSLFSSDASSKRKKKTAQGTVMGSVGKRLNDSLKVLNDEMFSPANTFS